MPGWAAPPRRSRPRRPVAARAAARAHRCPRSPSARPTTRRLSGAASGSSPSLERQRAKCQRGRFGTASPHRMKRVHFDAVRTRQDELMAEIDGLLNVVKEWRRHEAKPERRRPAWTGPCPLPWVHAGRGSAARRPSRSTPRARVDDPVRSRELRGDHRARLVCMRVMFAPINRARLPPSPTAMRWHLAIPTLRHAEAAIYIPSGCWRGSRSRTGIAPSVRSAASTVGRTYSPSCGLSKLPARGRRGGAGDPRARALESRSNRVAAGERR